MVSTTLGVVLIAIGSLVALASLEGIVLYASFHPTWKTGRASSSEGLHETGEPRLPPGAGLPPSAGLPPGAGLPLGAGPPPGASPPPGDGRKADAGDRTSPGAGR